MPVLYSFAQSPVAKVAYPLLGSGKPGLYEMNLTAFAND